MKKENRNKKSDVKSKDKYMNKSHRFLHRQKTITTEMQRLKLIIIAKQMPKDPLSI